MYWRPPAKKNHRNPTRYPGKHKFSRERDRLLKWPYFLLMVVMLGVIGLSVHPLAAKIYRYQDEDGNWCFTNAPPGEMLANPIEEERSQEKLLSIMAKSQDQLTRYKALVRIKQLKDTAMVEGLIEILKTHPEKLIRNYAASALGAIGDDRAVRPIIEAVDENRVDEAAYKALGEFGDKKALPALHRVHQDRNKPEFYRVTALKAIKKIEYSNGIISDADASTSDQTIPNLKCFRAIDEFKVDVPCNWMQGKVNKPSTLFDCPVIAYERAQNKSKNPTAYMDLIVLDNSSGKQLDSFLLKRSQGQLRIPSTDILVAGLKGFKKAYVYDPPKRGYYSYELSAVFTDGQKVLYTWGVGAKDFDRGLMPVMENAITTVRPR